MGGGPFLLLLCAGVGVGLRHQSAFQQTPACPPGKPVTLRGGADASRGRRVPVSAQGGLPVLLGTCFLNRTASFPSRSRGGRSELSLLLLRNPCHLLGTGFRGFMRSELLAPAPPSWGTRFKGSALLVGKQRPGEEVAAPHPPSQTLPNCSGRSSASRMGQSHLPAGRAARSLGKPPTHHIQFRHKPGTHFFGRPRASFHWVCASQSQRTVGHRDF